MSNKQCRHSHALLFLSPLITQPSPSCQIPSSHLHPSGSHHILPQPSFGSPSSALPSLCKATQQLKREKLPRYGGGSSPCQSKLVSCAMSLDLLREGKQKMPLSSLLCSALLVPVENEKKRGGKLKKNEEKKKIFKKEGSSRAQTIHRIIGEEGCSSVLCSLQMGKPSVLGSEHGLGDELKSSLLTLHTKPGQRAEVKPTGTRPSNQAHAESWWH